MTENGPNDDYLVFFSTNCICIQYFFVQVFTRHLVNTNCLEKTASISLLKEDTQFSSISGPYSITKKSLATNCSLQNPTSKRIVRFILERHFSIQLCKDTRYIRFFHYAKILKIDEVYVSKICTNVSSTIQEKIMNTIKLQKRLSKL